MLVREVDERAATAGRARIEKSLSRALQAGKLTGLDRDAALERIAVTTEVGDLADRDLVIEAATEDPGVKTALFADLDSVVKRPDAILVIGLHFFNPVPVQNLVELTPSVLTGKDTVTRARAFAADVLGKSVIAARDRAGFIVNSLLVPYLLSAIRMYEAGYATAEDIDTGMMAGCAHPMGPLALADFIGLDTVAAIADSMYDEYAEPLYAAPPLLRRMTAAGLLGRKAGRGFYDYPKR